MGKYAVIIDDTLGIYNDWKNACELVEMFRKSSVTVKLYELENNGSLYKEIYSNKK